MNYCLIKSGWFSIFINFLLIAPFIPLLNSSISSLPSYPLPLAALLNSCTNSSIILPTLISSILSLLPPPYLLLQILFLILPKIPLLIHIPLLLPPNLLVYSLSTHLQILPTYVTIPTTPVLLLSSLPTYSLYIACTL